VFLSFSFDMSDAAAAAWARDAAFLVGADDIDMDDEDEQEDKEVDAIAACTEVGMPMEDGELNEPTGQLEEASELATEAA
jgi:hypothetical protein